VPFDGWGRGTSVALSICARAVVLGLAATWPARAQMPVPRIPAGVPPVGSPLPGIVPPTELKVAPGVMAPSPLPPVPATQPGQSFAIATVGIDGMTAFPRDQLDAITAGLVGPAVTTGAIETARRAIVSLYRSNDYVYTTVRAVIRGDALRFQVVEGYVAEVKLNGDVGPAGTQVLRFLDHLVGEKPLQAKTLERWLLLASDIPGLTVRSTLDPSTDEPGALTLVARVSRKAVSGYLAGDNRAATFAGPSEGVAIMSLDSFSEFGERTQLSFYGAPGPNIFGQASEEFFVGGSGLKLKIYAGAGPAYPNGALAAIGYQTMTKEFGGQFSYPVIRVRQQTLNLTLAFDAIETNTDNNLSTNGSEARASYDSLRIFRLGTDYALFDTLLGDTRGANNQASILVSQGIIGLGSGRDDDTTTPPPRLGEKVDFTKVSGQFSRTQTLFSPYEEATVALREAVGWQATGDILPPVEKYYLGGPHFNRGYYYGQVAGDKALTVSTELQLNTPLPLPAKIPATLNAQFYTFYDWGEAWQNTRLDADVMLNSLGGGVRFFVNDSTEVDLEGVYRGNLYPNGTGPNVSALRTAAFYWQVSFRF
jgi:hemolysin activation/secretion protein